MKLSHVFLTFLVILSLIPLSFSVNAQFADYTERHIKAVAVVSGENRGATIDITVIVTPGNGRVFVSVSPFTEIDMQGSAQLAALTACDLTGNDFLKHDFFYVIEADSTIVGGPSAGAVMTVATIAALENLTLRDDVYMTGMVYPDGSIGPVGGIKYKLEAAAKDGAKIFLIPEGQRYEKVHENKEVRRGPFVVVTTETKTVDLVEYGKQIGVEVVEVGSINDALRYYTGHELFYGETTFSPEKYSDLMRILAERMKSDTLKLYEKFNSIADEEVKKIVDDRISQAEGYYENSLYYSSTSSYFTAKIIMREEIYRKTITNENSFSAEIKAIQDEIESMRKLVSSYELGLTSFQLIGAAEERLAKAENYLQKAQTSDNFNDAIANLALAKERVESAKVWMTLISEIKEDRMLDNEDVKRRADFYLGMARSIFIYSKEIGGLNSLLYGEGSAEESLNVAEDLYNNGYYAGTIFMALDSITKSALSIELLNVVTEDEIAQKAQIAEKKAEIAISNAEKYTTPMLAYAYFEFAKTSESIWKLYYFKLSERIAKTLVAIGGKADVEIKKTEYKSPELKTTPAVETIAEERIKKILAIPGFEGAIAIAVAGSTAILIGVLRRN